MMGVEDMRFKESSDRSWNALILFFIVFANLYARVMVPIYASNHYFYPSKNPVINLMRSCAIKPRPKPVTMLKLLLNPDRK